ncbi:hypothetical protein JTE90_009439 [Oedothorax gibbosus]|uniref:Scavenger receptor n=1 Tax=Oedothorax gibbosus TaxID=931172 RepID=A0AAV6VTJ8_9ARAC|nr:hypothetical protein JTE90_009439 [Oedothorax gibbosus]
MKTVSFFVDFFLVVILLNAVNGISVEDVVDEDDDESPSISRNSRCPLLRNKLKNGRVKLRSRGRIAKFLCDPGYELAGKRFTTCVRGQWNNPLPACVSIGCTRPPLVANAWVSDMYRGAVLLYECRPGYTMHGGNTVYCDGRQWSSEAPVCGVSTTNPMKSCDFEDPNLCGWSHDPTHDFDWKRNQFATPSGHVRTGPTADHTFGPGKGGFYLYIEASSPRKVNDTARLFSPVYPSEYSDGCFVFWYHMFGSQTGGLRVYVKPESHVFQELLPTWAEYGDQGNRWLQGNVTIPHFNENFQIVIEGIRGSGYISDTAIDDVRLFTEDCSETRDITDYTSEFSPTSCRGRCRETNDSYPCACDDDCVMSGLGIPCCEDFHDLCTKRPDGTDNPEEYGSSVSTFMPIKGATASEPGLYTTIQTPTSKTLTPVAHMPVPSIETVITTTTLSETPARSATTDVPEPATPTVSAQTFSTSTITTSFTSSLAPDSVFPSTVTSPTTFKTTGMVSSTVSIPEKVTFNPLTTTTTSSTLSTRGLFTSPAPSTPNTPEQFTISFESLTKSGITSSPLVTVPSARSTIFQEPSPMYHPSSSVSRKSTTLFRTTKPPLLSSTTPYTTSQNPTPSSVTYSTSKSTPIYINTSISSIPSTTSGEVISSPAPHSTTKSFLSSTISSRFRAVSSTTQGLPSSTLSSRFRVSSSTTQEVPSSTISSRFLATSSTTQRFPSSTIPSRLRVSSSTTQGFPSSTMSSRFLATSSTTQRFPSSTIPSRLRVSSSTTQGFPSSTMSSRFRATFNNPSSTYKIPVTTEKSTLLTSTRTTTRFTTASTTTVEETRRTYNLRPRLRTTPTPPFRRYYRSTTRRRYWYITEPTTPIIYPQPTTIKSTTTKIPTSTVKATFSSPSTTNTAVIATEETKDMSKNANHLTISDNSQSTVIILSVLLMSAACFAGGLVFYIRRWKSRRQTKDVDDSEMRYLYQSESVDYSDATALEKMNSNHHII